MDKDIDCDFTTEIVCPYCGEEHLDSWEKDKDTFDGSLDDEECQRCGKTFEVQRNGEITYSTSKVTPNNKPQEG